MQSLKELGFAEYYYLDNDKVYNDNKKRYVKEVGEFRYKLRTNEGKYKSVTLKEIYKKLFNKVFCKDNIELLEGESFREIPNTGGNYEASNLGRIKSKIGNHAIILKPTITPKGYERLQIWIEGQKYNKFVHSLVAAAWLEQPTDISPLDIEIHHLGSKTDNSINSIMYVSKMQHRKIHDEERRKSKENECAKSEEDNN